jgi:hypothetical protein
MRTAVRRAGGIPESPEEEMTDPIKKENREMTTQHKELTS